MWSQWISFECSTSTLKSIESTVHRTTWTFSSMTPNQWFPGHTVRIPRANGIFFITTLPIFVRFQHLTTPRKAQNWIKMALPENCPSKQFIYDASPNPRHIAFWQLLPSPNCHCDYSWQLKKTQTLLESSDYWQDYPLPLEGMTSDQGNLHQAQGQTILCKLVSFFMFWS